MPVGEKHLNQTRQKGSVRLLTWFADGVLDARHLSMFDMFVSTHVLTTPHLFLQPKT